MQLVLGIIVGSLLTVAYLKFRPREMFVATGPSVSEFSEVPPPPKKVVPKVETPKLPPLVQPTSDNDIAAVQVPVAKPVVEVPVLRNRQAATVKIITKEPETDRIYEVDDDEFEDEEVTDSDDEFEEDEEEAQ